MNNLRYIKSGRELKQMLPVLNEEYNAAGFLEPDAADIDVDALHKAFLRGAKLAGANILNNAEAAKIAKTRRACGLSVAARFRSTNGAL